MPLSAVREVAKRALHGAPEPGELPPPRRRVGERSGLFVHPKQVAAFLAATGGERIARFRGENAVVSPAFPALWEAACIEDLLCEPGGRLPGGYLLLERRESLHLRPLYPADRARCRVELQAIEWRPTGAHLTIESHTWNAAGQLCSRGTAVFVLSPQPVALRQGGGDEPGPAGIWREVARWKPRSGHGRRYTSAAGNPRLIRPRGWAARLASRRRPVLHSGCLEAWVTHALIEHPLGGYPPALRRLRIEFRTPIHLPTQLRLQVADGEGERYFRVVGREAHEIHAEGIFTGG